MRRVFRPWCTGPAGKFTLKVRTCFGWWTSATCSIDHMPLHIRAAPMTSRTENDICDTAKRSLSRCVSREALVVRDPALSWSTRLMRSAFKRRQKSGDEPGGQRPAGEKTQERGH